MEHSSSPSTSQSLDSAFHSLEESLLRAFDYAKLVAPSLTEKPELHAELVDSLIVLIARLDAFFVSLVSLGTRGQEQKVRRHFAKHGDREALECDMPTLIRLVRRRVSFERGGRRLENVFDLVFECSPWPSDAARDSILELVLLRNFLVHNAGKDWSQDDSHAPQYAHQFKTSDLLVVRTYGSLHTYTVDRHRALLFLRDASAAIVEVARELKIQLPRSHSQIEQR